MNNILIIAPAWVGDMVMAQSLFKMLKQQGASKVSVLAPKWTLEVAKRMPEVDEFILGDFAHRQLAFGQRKKLGKSLLNKFDTAIILPKSFKSALVPFFAKIPNRIGFIGELRYGILTDARKLNKETLKRTVDRFIFLGCSNSSLKNLIANPRLETNMKNQQYLKSKFNLSEKILTLCPGAEYGPSKQWSLNRFAEIANFALDNGFQIIALGSEKDSSFIDVIQNNSKQIINLAGKTTITDAIDLLSMSDKVLTNDSGLMHIAAAVGVEVFAIYGSTTAEMTPPLSDKAVIIKNNNISCSPCFKRECPLKGSDFHKCMQSITVNKVLKQMQLQT